MRYIVNITEIVPSIRSAMEKCNTFFTIIEFYMRRDKRDVLIIHLMQDLFLDSSIDKTTMCASILQESYTFLAY